MFKKGVTSLLAVSLLTIGGGAAFASTGTTQNQTSDAAVVQNESAATSGPIKLLQHQNSSTNTLPFQIATNSAAGQGRVLKCKQQLHQAQPYYHRQI
jgi:hypothetical protein